MKVRISAGEMLYIPAGWFHEVISENSVESSDLLRAKPEGSRGHLAFNYWFHPPDAKDFEKPYCTSFWKDEWKARGLEKEI
jgi:uncharacterized RmlC-like cupin family protein